MTKDIDHYSPFGKLLVSYRLNKGSMTRDQLAESIGKSYSYLAALEVGDKKSPTIPVLRAMIQTLGLSSYERHRLVDALLEVSPSETIRYTKQDVVPLLENIVGSDCRITNEELAWLLEVQSHFPIIISPDLVRSLVQERRRSSGEKQ